MAKSGGLRSLKALEFEKWGGLEPSSLTEVYASVVRSRKISEMGSKFRYFYRKSGSPSKIVTPDFAPEVAKCPKVATNPKIAQNRDHENDARYARNFVALTGKWDRRARHKNTTSDFAPELAKYPKSSPKPQIAQNGDLLNDARYARNFVALIGNQGREQQYDVRFCIGGS